MNKRTQIIIAGTSGLLAVVFGAFGSHGLKDIIRSESLEIYKTGVLYHLIHSILLLVLAMNGNVKYNHAFTIILAGIVLFSFSLYCYAITGFAVFAMITPFGGVSFLIGWILIIVAGLKET